jgi:tRNA dimethylallyltransferase
VLRALEVALATGRPLTSFQAGHGFRRARHPHLLIGLERPREELYRRIDRRCRRMWEAGLVEEVRGLLAAGVPPGAKSLGSLGYRQAAAFLAGEVAEEQALAWMAKATRAYAKRQLTWFRGMQGINWHSPEDVRGVAALVERRWPRAGGAGGG